jgi:hypothetical protein
MPDIPEFVKTASLSQLYGDHTTPACTFADPTNRSLPCHTKAACWNSAMTFAAGETRDDMIEIRLREKAHILGIGAEVAGILQTQKTASAAGDAFALTLDGTGHYPLRTPDEVKTAAAYLCRYAGEFGADEQHEFATNVLRKAAEFRVDASSVEKYARLGTAPLSWLHKALEARANVLIGVGTEPTKTAAAILTDLRQSLVTSPKPGERAKLAALLTELDRDFDLVRHYGTEFEAPAEVCYGVTKSAIDRTIAETIELVDGTLIEKSALARVTEDQCRAWLGDDIADAAIEDYAGFSHEKLAEILPTLPRPDARRCREMLSV